jgi:hypothetical protein
MELPLSSHNFSRRRRYPKNSANKNAAMKTKPITSRQAGTTLIVTLTTAAILATVLGTYLSITSQENLKVKRSIGWNAALPMAEAGIEEACSHVSITNIYMTDGWTFNPIAFAFNKTRTLGDGYYSVDINGWSGGVIQITSTGYGCWTGSNYISRTVMITARTPTPYFPSGLIANTINFGGTFSADSFDSRTNLYSTNGRYDKNKATDHALIASPSLTGFALGGTADIAGYVTAQGGLVTSSGATSVGDFSWVNSKTKGIQPGHWTNNFTMPFPPVLAPYGAGTAGVRTPTVGTNGATGYDYMLSGGFYYASNLLNSTFGTTMYVARDSVLVVTGNVALSQITFNPTNAAKLSLFFGYPSIDFQTALVNATTGQFWVYALPSCTYMKITGGNFMGVIYGPGMDLSAQGGASISGAIVARSFQCTGGFEFHSDDAAGATESKPFQILSWAEL